MVLKLDTQPLKRRLNSFDRPQAARERLGLLPFHLANGCDGDPRQFGKLDLFNTRKARAALSWFPVVNMCLRLLMMQEMIVEAKADVMNAEPTTRAGAISLASFAAHFMDEHRDKPNIVAVLRTLATFLSRSA